MSMVDLSLLKSVSIDDLSKLKGEFLVDLSY